VAELAGVDIDVDTRTEEEFFKDADMLELNYLNAYPLLQSEMGQVIFEFSAIASYLARQKEGLYGTSTF